MSKFAAHDVIFCVLFRLYSADLQKTRKVLTAWIKYIKQAGAHIQKNLGVPMFWDRLLWCLYLTGKANYLISWFVYAFLLFLCNKFPFPLQKIVHLFLSFDTVTQNDIIYLSDFSWTDFFRPHRLLRHNSQKMGCVTPPIPPPNVRPWKQVTQTQVINVCIHTVDRTICKLTSKDCTPSSVPTQLYTFAWNERKWSIL